MNTAIKNEWLSRLQTYRKGEGKLQRETDTGRTWCCLGVLADIYVNQTSHAFWERHVTDDAAVMTLRLTTGRGSFDFLLLDVTEWAEVSADNTSCLVENSDSHSTDICIKLDPDDPLLKNPVLQELASKRDNYTVHLSEVNDGVDSFDLIVELIRKYL